MVPRRTKCDRYQHEQIVPTGYDHCSPCPVCRCRPFDVCEDAPGNRAACPNLNKHHKNCLCVPLNPRPALAAAAAAAGAAASLGLCFTLVQVLASMIYTASTLHAAVNFPQRSIMSFAPNTPGSIYAAPPTNKVRRTVLGIGSSVSRYRHIKLSMLRFGRILFSYILVSQICLRADVHNGYIYSAE